MIRKLLLGYDIGSSSIKASLLDADSGELIASAVSPEHEMKIHSPQTGWAEQDPEDWWEHTVTATKKMISKISPETAVIAAIGISYQMHGLVIVDSDYKVLYPSIIWCDSRAVRTGNKAFEDLGEEYCLSNFLNSPGNFTASKLKWIKDNLPQIYSRIYKFMLPGDFIAFKMTGDIKTTVSGLSEGILWDFNKQDFAQSLVDYYGIDRELIPEIVPTFGEQGKVSVSAAEDLGIKPGIPVTYRAGDQPNNALSLNVLNPGEIASTAGTSGVIYGVAGDNIFDRYNRVNTFAHVNYSKKMPNTGVLLCINGTGIQYTWLKQRVLNNSYTYEEMNEFASNENIGSEGLFCYPFGNGAERVLKNRNITAHFSGINFNIHNKNHLIRAVQEGIAFAFRYGLDVMKEIGLKIDVVKAGFSNLYQSKVFREAFVNTCNVKLEMFNTDGSQGAARGAGIGSGFYSSDGDALKFNNEAAFKGLKKIEILRPNDPDIEAYNKYYGEWKEKLEHLIKLHE